MGSNFEENKNESVEMADYTLDIDIASDYYSAYLIIEIFNEENAKITSKEIESFLDEKNIVHGIDFSMIEKLSNNLEAGKFLIAKGKKHANGVDAEIDYKFETSKELHPEKNEDGSVDYKKLHLLQKAEEGEVLAEKKQATEGINGMTVTGKEIFGKDGKDVNFKIGQGVIASEDGLSIKAEYEGAINFENGKVEVKEILEFNDGVGVNTGNIEFHGKVIVRGVVENGYSIKASDDIIVDGIVEGATLISESNIEISKGIQGNDHAYIECNGSLKARFINSSELNIKGDISVDIIMHSKVVCNGHLIAEGRKGTVVGGEFTIKNGLEARIIGSEMGTITNLKVGIDNDLLNNYKKALDDSKEFGNELRELTKNEKVMKKKIESGNRNQLMLKKYKKLLERLKEITPIVNKANEDIKIYRKKIASLRGSKIVGDIIYPGVKINITNTHYNVKEKITRVEIIKADGDIKIIGR